MKEPDPTKYPHLRSITEWGTVCFEVTLPITGHRISLYIYMDVGLDTAPVITWSGGGPYGADDARAYAELIKEACDYAKELEL